MALYTVSLLFSLEVQAANAPEPLRELALHVVSAADEDEAEARGLSIGKKRENSYKNAQGETVRDVFKGVLDVQGLTDDHFFDGMEVASWMFRKGEALVIGEDGIVDRPASE
jgi:hypothetical protein